MNNKKKRFNFSFKIVLIFNIIIVCFTLFIYKLDSTLTPTALVMADSEMRARASEIIYKSILMEYSDNFKYSEIFHIEKDNEGNIVMINADTIKMNKIACEVALNSQQQLKKLGEMGISLPIGYILKNNLLSYIGPKVTIRMQPIGNIETSYFSEFSAAGINQTNHKIYIIVKTRVRVILPFKSNYIEIRNEVPIVDNVIVGKVPSTALQFDLKGSGINLKN